MIDRQGRQDWVALDTEESRPGYRKPTIHTELVLKQSVRSQNCSVNVNSPDEPLLEARGCYVSGMFETQRLYLYLDNHNIAMLRAVDHSTG